MASPNLASMLRIFHGKNIFSSNTICTHIWPSSFISGVKQRVSVQVLRSMSNNALKPILSAFSQLIDAWPFRMQRHSEMPGSDYGPVLDFSPADAAGSRPTAAPE